MQPPFSVGECLKYGWNEFKLRPAAYVLTTFVVLVLTTGAQFTTMYLKGIGFLLSLVIGPFYWFCTLAVANKGVSGAEPTLNDAFRPFTERQGDFIIVALAMSAGVLLCGIGVVITTFLFAFSPLYVLHGRDFKAAILESKDLVLKHPSELVLLILAIVGVNLLGALACGVGTLATTPITTLAFVKAYEELTRPGILTAREPGPGPTPIDPMPPAV
jgi:uncharacterized membrane protein